MKKVLVAIVVVSIAITLLNDLSAYAGAHRNLVEATRTAAERAAGVRGSREEAARVAAQSAKEHGVTVYEYDQDSRRVQVWAQADLEGTWVYAPLSALIEGRPASELPVLRHHETYTLF